MNKRQYRNLMKDVIKLQIRQIEDKHYPEYDEFHRGMIEGLRIAIKKLDASDFLLDVNYNEEVK